MEYFVKALKKYAEFNGRDRRKEYWMFVLFYIIFMFTFILIDVFVGTKYLSQLFGLVMFIPLMSAATRRLHDTTRSGWWQLIALIPFVGVFILFYFLAQNSHFANDYGQSPKLK